MFAGWFDHGKAAVLEQEREESGMSAGCFNKLNEHEVIQLLKCLGKSSASLAGLKKAAMVGMLEGIFTKLKSKELVIVESSSDSGASSSNDDKGKDTEKILQALYDVRADILKAIKASHDDDNESSNDGSHDDDNESSNDGSHDDDKCFVMKIFSEDQLPMLEQTTSGIGEDIDILARIKRGDGIFEDLRMVFQYTKITTIGELKADISSFTGCSVDDFKLRMVGRMMVMENFDIVDSYMRVVTGAKELEMCVSLRGGGYSIYFNVLFIVCC
jgi:hypothetical protein